MSEGMTVTFVLLSLVGGAAALVYGIKSANERLYHSRPLRDRLWESVLAPTNDPYLD